MFGGQHSGVYGPQRLGRSIHLTSWTRLLSGGRAVVEEGRNIDQVVGDDAQSDPAMHTIVAMVAAPSQSVTALQHTDPSFAPGAPALPPTKPALWFMGAPGSRLSAARGQDHATHASIRRGALVGRRRQAPVAGREIWRASKDLLMSIEPASTRRRPPVARRAPRRPSRTGARLLES